MAHPLIKPRHLKEGDTIGMISPAGSLASDSRYPEVVKNIESLGFRVKISAHARDH